MNRFIIADASKCIGCRTCEVACVVSHQENQDCASLTPETFLPRIHVIKGVNISTATVCRQCEDAPCANVCPVDAISREHGHIFVEQTRCIGCKSCMSGLTKPKPINATCATIVKTARRVWRLARLMR